MAPNPVVIWERSGEAFYSNALNEEGTVGFYLTVEALSDGRWSWLVWDPADDSMITDGASDTVQEAMRAAELVTLF